VLGGDYQPKKARGWGACRLALIWGCLFLGGFIALKPSHGRKILGNGIIPPAEIGRIYLSEDASIFKAPPTIQMHLAGSQFNGRGIVELIFAGSPRCSPNFISGDEDFDFFSWRTRAFGNVGVSGNMIQNPNPHNQFSDIGWRAPVVAECYSNNGFQWVAEIEIVFLNSLN
jgi:hypothetical protein